MNDKLYHYTDASGVLGIIKNSRLRATNHKFLNDISEYNYCFKHCTNEIKKLEEKTDLNSPHNNFYKEITNFFSRNRKDFYVCCFTEQTDSLQHWISYGRKKVNYCIEFDYHDLQSSIDEKSKLNKEIHSHFASRFSAVEYSTSNIENIIDNYLSRKALLKLIKKITQKTYQVNIFKKFTTKYIFYVALRKR